ncbi:MAG: nucleoside deaminase [Bacteroidota bacterium]
MKLEDKDFLKLAINLAIENVKSANGGPFGAVIVKDGVVLATGTNSVTTTNDPTMHAEIAAIRNACKKLNTFQLDSCTIYSSCEPCPMCLGAIYWARPERLVFAASKVDAAEVGFDDSFIYEEIVLDYDKRKIITEQQLPIEGKEPFEVWKSFDQRVDY